MKNYILIKIFLLVTLLLATTSMNAQISPSYNGFMVEISGIEADQFKGVDGLNARMKSTTQPGTKFSLKTQHQKLLNSSLQNWAKKCQNNACDPLIFTIKKIVNGRVDTSCRFRASWNKGDIRFTNLRPNSFKGTDEELQAIIDWLGSLEAQG